MSHGSLNPLQIRVLKILAGIGYQWRLTGGGALIIAYTHHRETEDLDLFFKSNQLSHIPREVQTILENSKLEVTVLQSALAFARLEIRDGLEQVILDLVADPVPMIEEPVLWNCEGTQIFLDTEHEIMVNKLCTLLSRSEVRDLIDVEALLSKGQDLKLAIQHAAQKDGGFSALTLAWVLEGFPLKRLATALEMPAEEIERLDKFKLELIKQLTEES
ncbi:MAG: nucleotidyl transferase AbiEii/AbiGii toxin family protein [Myxococcaceae bacterium]